MTDRWQESMRRLYVCRRVNRPLDLGAVDEDPGWSELAWSDEFEDITGDPALQPRFSTRVRMGWDDRFFYVNADLREPHVWGTITEKNAVMFEDNDFEIFIDPDCDGLNYYEFEINALGSIWELSLPKPYGDGGKPKLGCNIEGLVSRVRIEGTVNDPTDIDRGWTVEVAIPWDGLNPYRNDGRSPPHSGDRWRVNFSRVQWKHQVVEGQYVRIPPHGTPLAESLNPEEQEHPEDNWVWSPQGAVNMHLPERWGEVEFE
jgi:hypothetical protein